MSFKGGIVMDSLWHHPQVLIGFLIMIFICFVIPGGLTIWNIINCFVKKPGREKVVSTVTVILGGLFYLILLEVMNVRGEWYEPIYPDELHNFISMDYFPALFFPWVIGTVGYFLLLYVRADRLPPLFSVFLIANLILLNVIQIAVAVQLYKNACKDWIGMLFYVYHFNILLLSTRVIVKHMKEQVAYYKTREHEMNDHPKIKWLYFKASKLSGYAFPLLLMLFFIVALLEIFFVLAGQGLDAPVKAFTNTADWTFSKQIPPPPLEYEGHYLCTVAAGGHGKVVKPIRLGRRRGAVIVVNRQLCIANAFEELIAEKFPALHRRIRHFYDTYGYPVSRHITNPGRADAVYVFMKPLEWFFLMVLYLADKRPEARINRQYKM